MAMALTLASPAQKRNASFVYAMKRAAGAVRVDGRTDDAGWASARSVSGFHMITPMDTSRATVSTEVRMTFDDRNIYLLAVCHKKIPGPYRVESLRRDFSFGKNDNFLVFLDPFDDQVNGFAFGANAAGAQWDGTMYDGGKVDLNWDNKWTSVVTNTNDSWILEAAIPFKTLRYRKDVRRWGMNFSRLDIQVVEKSSWAPVPRQFPSAALAYTGVLQWEDPPPTPGTNVSVIPYVLAGSSKSFRPEAPERLRSQAGFDAKVGVTSSLNLDLTVNPDFSQVEVDRQVTNLDRFELFFPERRQFFLENGDQFSNFGYSTIRPFFSRRIGLNTPIVAGARLSGKIDKNWRVGAMDMLTGSVDSIGIPMQNHAVLALQRRVFARSNIGFLFIDRQTVGDTKIPSNVSSFNRNMGLEYNLASQNNVWTGKAILLRSTGPTEASRDWVHAANLQYSTREWTVGWQHEYVGKNYTAEVGYVPRRDHIRWNPFISRNFFPKGGRVMVHNIRVVSDQYFTRKWRQTDNQTYGVYTMTLRDQSTMSAFLAYDFIELRRPFDPTNSGKDTLARGTRHRWNAYGFEMTSPPQRLFTFGLGTRFGGYYAGGTRTNVNMELGYRFQPFVNLSLTANWNDIRMPYPWNRTTFLLAGPRIDVTFTNTLFFTAFLQYNDQQRNMNLNTRLQWRYRPASDLFIVYTDNYYTDPFMVRNRAVVLKLNYWWNL
jgi:hypothetical protein